MIAVMCLGWAGCGTDDKQGTRAECAQGGALTDCPDAERTSQGACWRLVDCGAIPLSRNGYYELDWDRCVREIQGAGDVQAQLIEACIGGATCDQLKLGANACLAYGDN